MFDFQSRINRLLYHMQEQVDGVLLSSPFSMRYYTGFTGGEGYVFIGRDGKSVVFTDFRYTEMVEKQCPIASCVEIKGGKKGLEMMRDWMNQSKFCFENVGIEEGHLSVASFSRLQEVFPCTNWAQANGIIDAARAIKDAKEIELIAKAEEIGDKAFTHILEFMKPGMTEREIALELEFFMRKQGAEGLSFDTIVASGENSSMPHAGVSDRVLQDGDLVTMDFGCVYDGYCSDMTRTVAVGTLSEKQRHVYDTVLEAQKMALEGIRPGRKCSEIDAIARKHIYDAGYEGCFGHSLGHSVGLYIHEEPRFAEGCDTVLAPGMVITVEPGIYLSGQYGVRIEDVIVVTEDGYRNLTHSEKALLFIKNS